MITVAARQPLTWRGRKMNTGDTFDVHPGLVDRLIRKGYLEQVAGATDNTPQKGARDGRQIIAEDAASLVNPVPSFKPKPKAKSYDS